MCALSFFTTTRALGRVFISRGENFDCNSIKKNINTMYVSENDIIIINKVCFINTEIKVKEHIPCLFVIVITRVLLGLFFNSELAYADRFVQF